MKLTPQEVLLNEFMSYYNIDEVESFLHDDLEKQADESAERMVGFLGDRAIEVATLMREIADDPTHPFYQTICHKTFYNWDAEPYLWHKFQILAQRMSDGITQAISGSSEESGTSPPHPSQDKQ